MNRAKAFVMIGVNYIRAMAIINLKLKRFGKVVLVDDLLYLNLKNVQPRFSYARTNMFQKNKCLQIVTLFGLNSIQKWKKSQKTM